MSTRRGLSLLLAMLLAGVAVLCVLRAKPSRSGPQNAFAEHLYREGALPRAERSASTTRLGILAGADPTLRHYLLSLATDPGSRRDLRKGALAAILWIRDPESLQEAAAVLVQWLERQREEGAGASRFVVDVTYNLFPTIVASDVKPAAALDLLRRLEPVQWRSHLLSMAHYAGGVGYDPRDPHSVPKTFAHVGDRAVVILAFVGPSPCPLRP